MKKLFKIKIFFLLTFVFLSLPLIPGMSTAQASNDYPIIFVHGLGWGFGDSILGLEYWGGADSIIEDLESQGHEVYTVNVSPFASNWDRACQLYAAIKGDRVDFGEAHSREFGHDRFGKTYEGVYPDWDAENKVHLVGHSMGGQTIRVLATLLEEGSSQEQEASTDISPLFSGNLNGWVKSVTSISTPHDGSLVADDINEFLPFVEDLIIWTSRHLDSDKFFNFGLDHWGLEKRDDETVEEYYDRLFDSDIWNTEDISSHDLSTQGAAELNSWVESQSNIYYFSISNSATWEGPISGTHYPRVEMNPLLWPTARLIGKADDPAWRENDGLVSVPSATHPTASSNDQKVEYDGDPEKGVWNYLGNETPYGHLGIVGLFRHSPHQLYRNLASILTNLGGDNHQLSDKDVYYNITSRKSGYSLDVDGANTYDGANVVQWDYHGGKNQQWKLEKVDTGDNGEAYYKIVARHSGKCLDVEYCSTYNYYDIQQYEYLGQKCQQWKIKEINEEADNDGYVKIINRKSGKAVDVEYCSPYEGENIQQYEYKNQTCQHWKLEPVKEVE